MKISDIVDNGLCVGCGVCTSENKTKEKFYKMELDNNGFLIPTIVDNSKEEPLESINVCPFGNSENNDEDFLADQFFEEGKRDDRIGKYINTYAGFSEKYRETSSSGGLATFVFEQLLKRKIVDSIYVVKQDEEKGYSYQMFSLVGNIKKISKTRYFPVTMETLFDEIDQVEGKVAISGVACFIKSVRLKQVIYPELKEKIPFLVGIICGGLKSSFYTDFLAYNAEIKNYSNQEYRIKNIKDFASAYSFGAYDNKDKVFKQMKMKKVGDMWGSGLFKSSACDFCTDVATELADISLGDAWIKPYVLDGRGTNIIITRNPLADDIIKKGIENNELSIDNVGKDTIIATQSSSFIHRQLGLKYRLSKTDFGFDLKVRKRFFRNLPIEYKRVQNYRSSIRNYSLYNWREEKDKSVYIKNIKEKQLALKKITRQYHRIQRVRGMIGLNNLKKNV